MATVELFIGFILIGQAAEWISPQRGQALCLLSITRHGSTVLVAFLRVGSLPPRAKNQIESLLQPFVVYLDLEMFIDANDELEKLPTGLKVHPTVLPARLELLMAMKALE